MLADWSAMDCTSPVMHTFIEPESTPFEAVMVAEPLFSPAVNVWPLTVPSSPETS